MSKELLDFKTELYNDIERDSFKSDLFPEESFFNWASHILCETGFIDEAQYSPYKNTPKGIRIDGYSWVELDRIFCAIIIDLSDDQEELSSISNTEVEALGKRVWRYLSEATSKHFRNSLFVDNLDVSSHGRVTADLIADIEEEVIKYRIIVVTDKVRSTREKTITVSPIADRTSLDDKPTSIEIWDLKRLMDLYQGSNETEEFEVMMSEKWAPIQVIEASRLANGTVTYLGVMPATVLSEIYDNFGQRLLESNVRTFLDFKNHKNRAMKDGILREPENFFAYNNGLTVTATAARIDNEDGMLIVKSLENMQIVNGGQTTATIYFTPREKGGISGEDGTLLPYKHANLNKVSVQMKLTILNARDNPEFCDKYKADIANYANFQTAVNTSDLTSNLKFHKDMERLSRKITTRTYPPTNWFYERTRGQYSTQLRGMRNEHDRKSFLLKFPKIQVFTKDELAKYEVTWQMQPHIVKKGTNPTRQFLMGPIEKVYKENAAHQLDSIYFENAVSKILLFKQLDSLISKSDWYKKERGLKAEAVTYTIALVRTRLLERHKDINLAYIFNEQNISENLAKVLVAAAKLIRKNIMSIEFRNGAANPAEFCRDEKGWDKIKQTIIDVSALREPAINDASGQVKGSLTPHASSKPVKPIPETIDYDVTGVRVKTVDTPKITQAEPSSESTKNTSALGSGITAETTIDTSKANQEYWTESQEYWEALLTHNKKSFPPLSHEVIFPMLKARSLRTTKPLSKKQNEEACRIYIKSKKMGFVFNDS